MKRLIKESRYWTSSRQEGSALAIALLILVFLTILGLSGTTISTIEVQIAANDKFQRIAFYRADSGIYSTPKFIRETMEEGSNPTNSSITYLQAGTDLFYRQIMGFDTYDSGASDFAYVLSGTTIQVDVRRTRVEQIAGGGAEFGAGAEGVGGGTVGGVAIYYTIDSLGFGPASAISNLEGEYRLVPGVAGGL
jgi:hypothetical protein